MNGIGWAVKQLWDGKKLKRLGWNGKDMWVALQIPDEHSMNTEPYVYLERFGNGVPLDKNKRYRIPWLCSQSDLLAKDWEIFAD